MCKGNIRDESQVQRGDVLVLRSARRIPCLPTVPQENDRSATLIPKRIRKTLLTHPFSSVECFRSSSSQQSINLEETPISKYTSARELVKNEELTLVPGLSWLILGNRDFCKHQAEEKEKQFSLCSRHRRIEKMRTHLQSQSQLRTQSLHLVLYLASTFSFRSFRASPIAPNHG